MTGRELEWQDVAAAMGRLEPEQGRRDEHRSMRAQGVPADLIGRAGSYVHVVGPVHPYLQLPTQRAE